MTVWEQSLETEELLLPKLRQGHVALFKGQGEQSGGRERTWASWVGHEVGQHRAGSCACVPCPGRAGLSLDVQPWLVPEQSGNKICVHS